MVLVVWLLAACQPAADRSVDLPDAGALSAIHRRPDVVVTSRTDTRPGRYVATADVNGDQIDDVAVSEHGAVSVHHGSSAGFQPTPDARFTSLYAEYADSGVALGDFDGDGHPDLAVGGMRGVDVRDGSATGITSARLSIDAYPIANGVVAGDVDGDGYDDLLLLILGDLDETWVQIYLGTPSGLQAASSADATANLVLPSWEAYTLRVGDTNGDGYDDVVVGDPTWNDQGRALVFRGSAAGIASGADGDADTVLTGPTAASRFGEAVAIGKIDGDAFAELVVGAPGANTFYLWNGEAGGVASGTYASADFTRSGPAGYGNGLFVADLAQSSHLDLAVGAGPDVWVYSGDGATLAVDPYIRVFGVAVVGAADTNDSGPAEGLFWRATDPNGRGELWVYDSVPGSIVYQRGEIPDEGFGRAVAAGDFDGDGVPDVAVGVPRDGLDQPGSVVVFPGRTPTMTSAHGEDAGWRLDAGGGSASFGSALAAGDFDGDDFDDLAVAEVGTLESRVRIYPGSALGLAPDTYTTVTGLATDAFGWSLVARDVDDDGLDDLVVGAPDTAAGLGAVYLFFGAAAGIPSGGILDADDVVLGTGQLGRNLALGHLDADAFADLVAVRGSDVVVYAGSASGFGVAPSATIPGAGVPTARGGSTLAVGDVDCDGTDDVVALVGQQVRAYLATSAGLPDDPDPVWALTEPLGSAVGLGDLNGDGCADPLVARQAVLQVSAYEGTPVGPPLTADLTELYLGRPILAWAFDLDVDGFDDLLVGAPYQVGGVVGIHYGDCNPRTLYTDGDGDGQGDPATGTVHCGPDPRLVADGRDCDDTDADVRVGATEICNGLDDDCDTLVDLEDPSYEGPVAGTFYVDADADGYGDPGSGVEACATPTDRVPDGTDCDDTDGDVNPGAAEVCDPDDVDEDCSGAADDADPSATGQVAGFLDADGDGFGAEAATLCDLVEVGADCDDADATIYPGAPEVIGDRIDQDCDGADQKPVRTAVGGSCGGCDSAGASPPWALLAVLALARGKRRG